MLEPVFSDEQIRMLNTPLTPGEIEQKQGMSYLKGQLAVVKANNIFGYGNWGYQLASGVEVINTETENKNHNVIYRVRVAVTLEVRGCMPITEIGDCEAQGTGPAAMSMAEKGAVTDGLKRCLKNFGPTFGLDLYFKTPPAQAASQPTQRTQQVPTVQHTPIPQQQQAARPVTPPAPIKPNPAPVATAITNGEKATEPQVTAILKMSGKQGLDEIELYKRLRELYGTDLRGLSKNDAGHFIQVLQGK